MDVVCSIKIVLNSHIIAGNYDSNIRIWNLESARLVKTLKGHKDWVYALSTHLIDQNSLPIVISGSYDSSVKIWDTKTKKGIRKIFSKGKK